ncbi:MAG: hypothetical protein HYU63_02985 [Armatimonadetes bacterium]|nr:hypothetical protein [Armatimonadota bacterium]
MRKIYKILLFSFLFSILIPLINISVVQAQLILVNDKYDVIKIDIPKNRIEALNYKKKAGIVYILIDGYTKIYQNEKSVPWTRIKVRDVIRVKGGVTWDFKVKAKEIWINKN